MYLSHQLYRRHRLHTSHSHTINHQLADSFVNAHADCYNPILNTFLTQASIASFCLDRWISYKANATGNPPCLSFSVDIGRLYQPVVNDTAIRWFCTAVHALLTLDLYEAVDVGVESYMHAIVVNPLCGGTFRGF